MFTGAAFSSINPATEEIVWSGPSASADDVGAAVQRAQAVTTCWSELPFAERAAVALRFAEQLTARKAYLAETIARENGKPLWESLAEVQSMIGKVAISIEAHQKRCRDFSNGSAVTRFRPHGVVAVYGPFNFPGHLPNGHIVPALLAGNTVLFKPSEYTPLVALETLALWRAAGVPEGVLQVLPGAAETGRALAEHPEVRGIFFTGSARVGLHLQRTLAESGKILALEMGGNNPLVVWPPYDPTAAALIIIQSAFLSAGQRCTCARRLIVGEDRCSDELLSTLVSYTQSLRVGPWTERPEPFLGPVIRPEMRERLLQTQATWRANGAVMLLAMCRKGERGALVTPGIIDVTAMPERADEEIFGPLLQVIRVSDFAAALKEANRTRYGLAAGLLCEEPACWETFRRDVRAGVVNWNTALTGASSAAPFGGVGLSGNYRPSAYLAADYCSYPVASLEHPHLVCPVQLPPGLAGV